MPFVNHPFEWGVAITQILSILSIVPRHCAHCAHSAYFSHPKLREITAVLLTPRLSTLTRLNIGTELVGEGTSAMTGEGHQE